MEVVGRGVQMKAISIIMKIVSRGASTLLMCMTWRWYIVHPDKWDKMSLQEFGIVALVCILFATTWYDFPEEEKK